MNRYNIIILTFCALIIISAYSANSISMNMKTAYTSDTKVSSSQNTVLQLQLFADKRFITTGDRVNITFYVFSSNFTFQQNVVVTFTFAGVQFTELSASHLTSFLLGINGTYTQVSLVGSVSSDQQSLVFYGVSQKPTCLSSCLQAQMNISQLQVFNNFNGSFLVSILSNEQWFYPTDMLDVRLPNQQLSLYLQPTNQSYYGSNLGYEYNLTISIPVPILNPGSYSFQFDYYSRYYPLLNTTKQFTLASSSIGYTITNSSVNRLNIGESPKDFVTYQFGFNIANFQYLYFISNAQSIVFSASSSVNNVLLQLPISIQFYNPVGTYYLNLELVKNNVILYTRLIPITVYDNIITDLVFNNQLSGTQLSIQFQLNTYIEDTLVNIPTNVSILNANTLQSLQKISVYGIQYFTLTFPNVKSIPTLLEVITNSSNSLYHAGIKFFPIYYKEATNITSNYNQSIQVERSQQIQLLAQVTATKTNVSVTQGMVNLQIDGITIQELNLNFTNVFTYVIPSTEPVGLHTLQLNYLGTDTLQASTISYNLVVYSNVHFSDVTINNTFTNPTTPILVTGLVLDENNNGVITKVAIIDSNNSIIDQTVTNSNGQFSFIILNTNIMGYYNYKLQAMTVNYYKSAEYQFNLLQNNVFSVSIQANETMTLGTASITGDIYGEYQLSYFTTGSRNYNLSLLNLNNVGKIQTNFLTPNVIGPVYFNITNIRNPTQTWVQKFILYKTPNVIIQQLNDAFVGEKVNISIQSDVYYTLFFNSKLVVSQLVFINKTIVSLNVDTKGINTLKLVFSSEYFTINAITKEIFVYEQVILKQTIPAKINENTNITVYLQVDNNLDVPLGNVQIEFIYKGTILFNETTDNKGFLKTFISVNDALSYYSFRIVGNKDQYIKQEDFPVDSILIRTLEITSNINSLSFNDLTPTIVSFTVIYKNTGQLAPLVNMTIVIFNGLHQKLVQNVTTSNSGSITIQIKEPIGNYILTILTNDPNYIMGKSVYTFQVEGFNVIDNPFIVPTFLLGGIGIMIIIKKKSLR